jgi:hypothetical protein
MKKEQATLTYADHRALDAEIAVKVMGWTVYPEKAHPSDNRTINDVLYCPPDYPYDKGSANVVPEFSSDIAAAFTVVEHLRQKWIAEKPEYPNCFDIEDRGARGWKVRIFKDDGERYETIIAEPAPTLMLAICKAALALKVEQTNGANRGEEVKGL